MAAPSQVLEPSTLALGLVFSANLVVWTATWAHERWKQAGKNGTHQKDVATDLAGSHGKQLAEPLSMTLKSVQALSQELAKLGLLLGVVYCAEKHPPFPHAQKIHDMDMFWFVACLLAVVSFMNIRKSKGGDILNREQTEEWKGWMQFMFLMYHYFSAHEVYNSIRVFITCYVWMTGFGNFSFFYMKADFGLVRLLQMLWRLNFLVACLCMTLGTTYILYYICPLHTFYFLLVYVVMGVWQSANHAKWGIRLKIFLVSILVYVIWDVNSGLFPKLFFFLGTTPKLGAGSGSMWEWYFRTSLDHWSTVLGMVFALNFPMSALWLKKVEGMPPGRQWAIKGSVSAVLLALAAWWAAVILPQDKLDYNRSNAYFGVAIPLLTFIFLRNLSPTLRTHYLEPLHSLGKITLETYLMQHHVWLTSNAKTLLVLVPGYPKLNLLICTILYVTVSQNCYRLTMNLRGMILPDDQPSCIKNLAGLTGVLGVCWLVAKVVLAAGGAWAGLGVVHLALLKGGKGEEPYTGGLLGAKTVGPALAAVLVLLSVQQLGRDLDWARHSRHQVSMKPGPTDICLQSLSHGMWKQDSSCGGPGDDGSAALCSSVSWVWVDVPDQCHFHYMGPPEFEAALSGRRVVILGDSVEREVYYSVLRSLGQDTSMSHNDSTARHEDLSWKSATGTGVQLDFIWAPLVTELTTKLTQHFMTDSNRADLVLFGGGLWDALHGHDINAYVQHLPPLAEALDVAKAKVASRKGGQPPLTMFVRTTATSPSRMTTPEKKQWLTDEQVQPYRDAFVQGPVMQSLSAIIDGYQITSPRRQESYDGVHYPDYIYDAMSQLLGNALEHYGWNADGAQSVAAAPAEAAAATHKIPKTRVGSMGNTQLGAMVLGLLLIMLLFMDSYHALPTLALKLLGGGGEAGTLTWEQGYGKLLRKLNMHPDQRPTTNAGGLIESEALMREAEASLEMTPGGAHTAPGKLEDP